MFPTNPELADIFCDTDFDDENAYFFVFSRFPDFQVPGFPDSRLSAGMAGSRPGGAPVCGSPRGTKFERSEN